MPMKYVHFFTAQVRMSCSHELIYAELKLFWMLWPKTCNDHGRSSSRHYWNNLPDSLVGATSSSSSSSSGGAYETSSCNTKAYDDDYELACFLLGTGDEERDEIARVLLNESHQAYPSHAHCVKFQNPHSTGQVFDLSGENSLSSMSSSSDSTSKKIIITIDDADTTSIGPAVSAASPPIKDALTPILNLCVAWH